jgi:hypothetical protein
MSTKALVRALSRHLVSPPSDQEMLTERSCTTATCNLPC